MLIQIEERSAVTVFFPTGRLDSNNAGEAEAEVLSRIESGSTRIIFDLKDLEYISSAGLRIMLLTAKRLHKAEGRMALCNLRDHIREVFEISGFLTILQVYDNHEDAHTYVRG